MEAILPPSWVIPEAGVVTFWRYLCLSSNRNGSLFMVTRSDLGIPLLAT